MNSKSLLLVTISLCTSAATWAECNSQMSTTAPKERFVIHDNGTVTDTTTGLMWKRCAEGFSWQGDTCELSAEAPQSYNWGDALAASTEHSFAGLNGWRLPNKIELASIVEYSCYEPAINGEVFPNTPVNSFWSNTPNNFNISFAWAVNFSQGEHTTTRRTHAFAVRLVRAVDAAR